MTDPIRVALEAAYRAECMARARVNECQDEPCGQICGWCREGATAAIAAFLRAISPDVTFQFRSGEHRTALDAFADAVLAAAKDRDNG